MEIFILLTILLYVPFLMYYFAFRNKKSGAVNPLRNRLRMFVIRFNLILFLSSLILIYTNSENDKDWNDFWIKIPILSLGISAVPFFYYLIELVKLDLFNLEKYEKKIHRWHEGIKIKHGNNNWSDKGITSRMKWFFPKYFYSSLEERLKKEYEIWIDNKIIEGTFSSFLKFVRNQDLIDLPKLKFLYNRGSAKQTVILSALFAFYDRYYCVLDEYATAKDKKAIRERMHENLNKYFEPINNTNKFRENDNDLGSSMKQYIIQYSIMFGEMSRKI